MLDQIYTPQAIVNGNIQFTGSNEKALKDAVSKELNSSALSNIEITAEKKANSVLIRYTITGSEDQLLNTAIVLPKAITNVKRGENGGRILKHVNIVSNLKVSQAKPSGEISIDIPKDLTGKSFALIACKR